MSWQVWLTKPRDFPVSWTLNETHFRRALVRAIFFFCREKRLYYRHGLSKRAIHTYLYICIPVYKCAYIFSYRYIQRITVDGAWHARDSRLVIIIVNTSPTYCQYSQLVIRIVHNSYFQNIRISEYQIIRILEHQNIRISEYQIIRISEHQNIRISEYQNI